MQLAGGAHERATRWAEAKAHLRNEPSTEKVASSKTYPRRGYSRRSNGRSLVDGASRGKGLMPMTGAGQLQARVNFVLFENGLKARDQRACQVIVAHESRSRPTRRNDEVTPDEESITAAGAEPALPGSETSRYSEWRCRAETGRPPSFDFRSREFLLIAEDEPSEVGVRKR